MCSTVLYNYWSIYSVPRLTEKIQQAGRAELHKYTLYQQRARTATPLPTIRHCLSSHHIRSIKTYLTPYKIISSCSKKEQRDPTTTLAYHTTQKMQTITHKHNTKEQRELKSHTPHSKKERKKEKRNHHTRRTPPAIIPMTPLSTPPNRPPRLSRNISSKHVKVILNKEPPSLFLIFRHSADLRI